MSRKSKVFKEIFGWMVAFIIPIVIVFTLSMEVFAISGIDQSSMHNTLFEGEVVYFNRMVDKISELNREDIILFLTNGREKQGFWDELSIRITDFADKFKAKAHRVNERYVKRIIGIPGDVIDITNEGEVYINGVKENKAYVIGSTPPGNMKYPLTVPEDHLFVMGDNREISEDSRHFSFVSIRSLEGKAEFLLWPPSKVGAIR